MDNCQLSPVNCQLIPAGYKRTEVGVIPEDWIIKELAAICDVRDGTHESPEYYDQGVAFVTSKNIIEGHLDLTNVNYISDEDAVRFNQRSKVDRGDILMSMIGTIGNSVLIDFEPSFCIKNVALIKPRGPDSQYLIQLLNSLLFQGYLNENLDGGIQKFIALGTLRKLVIPLPPLPEQRAIAEVLSDVDALIAALDRLIAKKRAIKQGAMQQLLTGKTRLPGFGGKWETKPVRCFGEIVTGGTPSTAVKGFWNGTIPWITPTDISDAKDIYTSDRLITPLGLKTVKSLPANSVLVTCIASIGKNAVLKAKGACNQQINAIIPNSEHDADFLYYLVDYNKSYLLENAGITATRIISKRAFSELLFSAPPLPEQRAIATVLSDMDAEIAALEARRDKTRALKQGMMQELLTGRTRLIDS